MCVDSSIYYIINNDIIIKATQCILKNNSLLIYFLNYIFC